MPDGDPHAQESHPASRCCLGRRPAGRRRRRLHGLPAAGDAHGAARARSIDPPASAKGDQVAVLAGGCFWGLQAVFEHVKGVKQVWAGYAGGSADTASYYRVGEGDTGHAESVKIVYDPSEVSYGQLLKVYFSVAHRSDPAQPPGPDSGTQYRSEIFTTSAQQKQVARPISSSSTRPRSTPAPS